MWIARDSPPAPRARSRAPTNSTGTRPWLYTSAVTVTVSSTATSSRAAFASTATLAQHAQRRRQVAERAAAHRDVGRGAEERVARDADPGLDGGALGRRLGPLGELHDARERLD